MKLLRRGECLLPPRRGNVNNRLRPEKVQSSCFRTGVRFPSAPPCEKPPLVGGFSYVETEWREKSCGFDRMQSAAFTRPLRETQRALRSKAMRCGTEPAQLAEYSPQFHHAKSHPLWVAFRMLKRSGARSSAGSTACSLPHLHGRCAKCNSRSILLSFIRNPL